ncbi:energy transducer TonB [Pedomonas mirosovicensis]|uniref:energy transducer TonB n=1 Tax=Pedomonas mirosovicensis TaxID=2908641 RepID=UPI002168BC59|nr:energy transducer TonB [Pedomonas mirosovicensis]MCH8686355.1 energy transducer TonB [Pedomonas mirosovicensis]
MPRFEFWSWFRAPWRRLIAGRNAGRGGAWAAPRDLRTQAAILGSVIGLHLAILAALLSYRLLLPEAPDEPIIRLEAPLQVPPARDLAGMSLAPVPLPDLAPALPVPDAEARAAERAPKPRPPEEIIAEEALTPAVAAHSLNARGFDLVSPPRYAVASLRNRLPDYPAAARQLREEGVVILRVLVSPAGKSLSVDIYQSSGHARLDQAARQAILRWAFLPAERGRQPVTAWLLVPIRFIGGVRVLVDEAVIFGGQSSARQG